MNNYYFNISGIYTHSLPATAGTLTPDNALRVEPTFNKGFHPILNEAKDGWTETPDHRQKKDDRDRIIEGSGTAYYLPEDNHQSEAKYMTELGELPKNALLIKPIKTLAEAKTEKLEEITRERDNKEQAGFDYMGKTFDADATSVQRLTLAAQSASLALASNEPFTINWTVQDDSSITLNAAEMLGVVPAIATHADTLHQEGRKLKNAVNNATTLDEVEAIVWE